MIMHGGVRRGRSCRPGGCTRSSASNTAGRSRTPAPTRTASSWPGRS